jgi:PAS domain S-box-containing protein
MWRMVQRRRAEEETRTLAQRLALHLEHTPLGVIEWDTAWRVTAWNRAAENMFGYTRDEAIGSLADELIVPDESREPFERGCGELRTAAGNSRATVDTA